MRTSTFLLLLSLVTLSLCAGFRLISYGSTAHLLLSPSSLLLAATQSEQEENKPPPSGGQPKRFFQSQENLNS